MLEMLLPEKGIKEGTFNNYVCTMHQAFHHFIGHDFLFRFVVLKISISNIY